MLRQLASRVARLGGRGISTTAARLEGEAAPAGLKEFSEAWTATAPSTMAVPEINESFLEQKGDGPSLADGEKFPVNFYTPYGVLAEDKVRRARRACRAPRRPSRGTAEGRGGIHRRRLISAAPARCGPVGRSCQDALAPAPWRLPPARPSPPQCSAPAAAAGGAAAGRGP
jgi:hypothetical protein